MSQDTHILIWNRCLKVIEQIVSSRAFDTWFKPIVPVSFSEGMLTVSVPSEFFREYLEEYFLDVLNKTVRKEIGADARLAFRVAPVKVQPPMEYPAAHCNTPENNSISLPSYKQSGSVNPFVIPGIQRLKVSPQLNPNYCFANLAIGECNKMGVTAGESIAMYPGKTAFNPLFVHGATGLGKTHLLNAIGLQSKLNNPDLTVLYVSAELFTQQFMDACRNKTTNDFTHFYQVIDVLLIDDIHKLSGKPATQDAFFQIFNQLHQSGKQLVISSDKPPVELQGIEQRLLSRFKWGLAADLQVPDVETRIAILKRKIQANGVEMPKDVIEYIAYSISTNVREMEGVLNSLLAQSILNKKTITMELAKQMIDQIVHNSVKEISIDYIQKIVCDYFDLPVDKLNSNRKFRPIVTARQLAMYFARKYTKASLAAIGSQCGKRDHSTVLHACKTVRNMLDTDKSFRAMVDELDKKIKN